MPKKIIFEIQFGIFYSLVVFWTYPFVAAAANAETDGLEIMSQPIASNSTSIPEIGSLPEKHHLFTSEPRASDDRDNGPIAHNARSSHITLPTGVGEALARAQSRATARSLASVDRLSTESDAVIQTPSNAYHSFSPAVVALLMPASVFGVLARLGLEALATYDGNAIFPLAYPQAVGCLIMGFALPLKDTISN